MHTEPKADSMPAKGWPSGNFSFGAEGGDLAPFRIGILVLVNVPMWQHHVGGGRDDKPAGEAVTVKNRVGYRQDIWVAPIFVSCTPFQSASAGLPKHPHDAGIGDIPVFGDEGHSKIERGGDNQPVGRVAMRQAQGRGLERGRQRKRHLHQ